MMMPRRGARAVDHDAVEPVGAHVGERRVNLVALQPRFLRQRRVGPADVQAVWRHREIGGNSVLDAMRIDLYAEAEVSTVSAIAFIATQQPE